MTGIEIKHRSKEEIIALAQVISNFGDMKTIMEFGSLTSENISKLSDEILQAMEAHDVRDTGVILTELENIMEKFEIKDFQKELEADVNGKESWFSKLMNRASKKMDEFMEKYKTMHSSVEKIYVELRKNEEQIDEANSFITKLFDKNLEYIGQLDDYIEAGEIVIKAIENEVLPKMKAAMEANTDPQKTQELELQYAQAETAMKMIKQRVMDLTLAKDLAYQTIPQLRMLELNNLNLKRQINSAFVVTIPAFKKNLNNAIMVKRQMIQQKMTKALRQKTNEMISKNAENIALTTKLTQAMTNEGFVDVKVLEESWNTIIKGIQDTRDIEQKSMADMASNMEKVKALKEKYLEASRMASAAKLAPNKVLVNKQEVKENDVMAAIQADRKSVV